MMMSTPSDSNISNPKEVAFIPATQDTDGNPIVPDDYTILFAPSDVNNTPPAISAFTLSATVPTKDLTPAADGKVHVPITDLGLSTRLAAGVWAVLGETDLGTAVSDPSNMAFFNIPAPKPQPPTDFGVA
jgi:hypothetical protein